MPIIPAFGLENRPCATREIVARAYCLKHVTIGKFLSRGLAWTSPRSFSVRPPATLLDPLKELDLVYIMR